MSKQIDQYESAEALALTQLMEIFQQLSGGVRREKKVTLLELQTFISAFTTLSSTGTYTILNSSGQGVQWEHLATPTGRLRYNTLGDFLLETGASLTERLRVVGTSGIVEIGSTLEFLNSSGQGVSWLNAAVSTGHIRFDTLGRMIIRTGAGLSEILRTSGLNLLLGTTVDNSVDLLQCNGTAANTSGAWAVLSDKRLKENIRSTENPIDNAIKIADSTKKYNYKKDLGFPEGIRTQYVAQELIKNGFDGHVTEAIPTSEKIGVLLGWEYGDEQYSEFENIEVEEERTVQVIKTEKGFKREIIEHKIVEVPCDLPVYKTVDKEIIVKNKDGKYVIETISIQEPVLIDIKKNVKIIKKVEVKKTRRIVLKEGDKVLQVENNFAPYAFPAIKALKEENDYLKNQIAGLIKRIEIIEG